MQDWTVTDTVAVCALRSAKYCATLELNVMYNSRYLLCRKLKSKFKGATQKFAETRYLKH